SKRWTLRSRRCGCSGSRCPRSSTVIPLRQRSTRSWRKRPKEKHVRNKSALAVLFFSIAAGCGGNKPRSAPQPKDVNTVTSEDMAKHAQEPIEKMLQGKVPGLLVSRTGDGQIAVQIRGAT